MDRELSPTSLSTTLSGFERVVMVPTTLLSPKPHASYLPHLDGLRAVALIGVLLFHFEVPGAEGGFAGVDCFLVLSGFLITRNILRAKSENKFSFKDFYRRRFWRLYPASLATCLLALCLAFLLSPSDLALTTAKSALASILFCSNIYFFNLSDYFDNSAVVKPLLHMWSLSLEEQFYLFWPFILVTTASGAFSRRLILPLFVAFASVASLTVSMMLQKDHSSFVFFMLPCRIYEFGTGAFCAILESKWTVRQRPEEDARLFLVWHAMRDALSLVALAAILRSFFAFHQHASPIQMLPFVLATAVVIATPTSVSNRWILSNPVMRFIGATSYAAYLMHWVIYVFARQVMEGLGFDKPGAVLMTVLTMLSAIALRYSVEDKMRKPDPRFVLPVVLVITIAILMSISGMASEGWRFRFNGEITTQDDSLKVMRALCIDEKPTKKRSIYGAPGCVVGDHSGNATNLIVIGDSFAQQLIPALDIVGKRRREKYKFRFAMGCPLYSRKDKWLSKRKVICRTFTHVENWKFLDQQRVQKTIFVANSWGYNDEKAHKGRVMRLYADLKAKGHKMIVAAEPPGIEENKNANFACLDLEQQLLTRFFRFATGRRGSGCVPEFLRPRRNRQLETENYMRIAKKKFYFINIFNKVCRTDVREAICRPLCSRNPNTSNIKNFGYERDGFHLNVDGSRFVADIYEDALANIYKKGGYVHVRY